MRRTFSLIGVVAALAALMTEGYAQIVSTSGQVTVLATPPASVVEESLESNTTAYVFTEQTNFVLPVNINVDATLPGTYTSAASLTPGTIAAGTPVHIYFLHSDTVEEVNWHSYEGTITFAQPILGVIVLKSKLDGTDSLLGAPGTAYPTGGPARGLEFSNPDHFSISADSKTLWFHFTTLDQVDQMRILTAVPEPGSLMSLGAGVALLMRLRRRRR